MDKFNVVKDGQLVEVVEADDIREFADEVVKRHGDGIYNISRQREDFDVCEECGGPWNALLGCDCELELDDEDEA